MKIFCSLKSLMITLAIASGAHLFAQDPFFTNQSFGYSMINPALTGSTGMLRAETGYRLQWPNLAGNYKTMNVSGDIYTRAGGVGVNYTNDNAGGIVKTNRVDINYAYGFRLWKDTTGKAKIVIQPGIQISYYSKTIDWYKLTYGDMIDPRRGFVFGTNAIGATPTRTNIDFSTGLLIMSDRVSLGLAAFHLSEPDEGYVGQSKLPMRFVLHASGILWNTDPDEPGAFRLVPSFVYMKQGDAEQLALFTTVHYRSFSLGVGYRNPDAVLLSAGFMYSHFTLSYSYDHTTSHLQGYTGGAHELHLGFTFLEDKWKYNRTNMRMYY